MHMYAKHHIYAYLARSYLIKSIKFISWYVQRWKKFKSMLIRLVFPLWRRPPSGFVHVADAGTCEWVWLLFLVFWLWSRIQGNPEAASKNHYFTRGNSATLQKSFLCLGVSEQGGKQTLVKSWPVWHRNCVCRLWLLSVCRQSLSQAEAARISQRSQKSHSSSSF